LGPSHSNSRLIFYLGRADGCTPWLCVTFTGFVGCCD